MRDPPPVFNRSHDAPRPLLLVVEGANDIQFLMRLSRVLAVADPEIPDLKITVDRGDLIMVPFGGGNPIPWASRLAALRCPELHVYDREVEPETEVRREAALIVNFRPQCRAFLTRPRALENYLHPAAIAAAGGGSLVYGPDDCVAGRLARRWHEAREERLPWPCYERLDRQKKIQKAKRWLNTVAVSHMSAELLAESDPHGDLRLWLRTIVETLPAPAANGPVSGRPLGCLCSFPS